METRDSVSMVQTGGLPPDASSDRQSGFHARVLCDGIWGSACASADMDPAEILTRAVAAARTAGGRGSVSLARIPSSSETWRPVVAEPVQEAPASDKAFLCRRYRELLESETQGASCRVAYRDFRRLKAVLNSAGCDVMEEEQFCGFRMEALSSDTGLLASRERAGRSGLEFFRSREDLVGEVAAECSALESAVTPPDPGSRLLLDPENAGVFIHEVFGHLCESGAHPLASSLGGYLRRGSRLASPCVNIVDDSTHFSMPGSCAFDDEGVPGTRTPIVTSGVLSNLLHTLETAGAAGVAPTGNARAAGFRSLPGARMTCTYLAPGSMSLEAMTAMLSDGLYLVGSLGGSTDMGGFSLTSRLGWRIESGRPTVMTGPVTIHGRVFDFLKSIQCVGSDLTLYSGPGGCSSVGDDLLPVSYGAPHTLVFAPGRSG
ncbi:MAG TPA: TldD/PmbA family protein [Candidatus Fermentibacter daniensis]|nr:MAG: hypothetical protein AO395_03460 [Candidatus Fermentibacter daniensis]MBP7719526.1 TldD/PmbA family protein [Candidatus Fermentibacter sp.]KZD17039.1 MAG: hypothetical protein AO396_00585 [Candidatus Fermentibacter daniensis]KZD17780.1 MAG: hypothetical protein AO394_04510 [Candidatus Fermentibacter daniensis]NLI02160.1 TldD/PmbA family protein [Candidatus Fermentibacter daniensis]